MIFHLLKSIGDFVEFEHNELDKKFTKTPQYKLFHRGNVFFNVFDLVSAPILLGNRTIILHHSVN